MTRPIESLFFWLIRYAISSTDRVPESISEAEWYELYDLSRKQTLLGVTFQALEHLPQVLRPSRKLVMQWTLQTEMIKERNQKLNRRAAQLVDLFRHRGFESVILKGQGLAQLYDSPELRCPGDIDIWIEGSESRILTCVSQLCSFVAPVYHNVACRIFDDVAVEVHFRPSWMNNYFTNRRLQRYFATQFPKQKSHWVSIGNSSLELPIPTVAFNRIFVLIHIYRHLFGEGIGLRQLLDYYYVLKQGTSEEEREQAMRILAELGMTRFARGIMHVLQHVFGLESRYLLCEPCVRNGEMLLSEIMIAGNFGHYDPRISRKNKSELEQFVAHCRRNFRFVHYYPSEVLWAPLFKIWHLIWRTRYKRANNYSSIS